MRIVPSRWGSGTALLALLCGVACGSDQVPSEFDPVYYAVAYGTVQQNGDPVLARKFRGEIYLMACPPTGSQASSTATRSGASRRYRLLLASADSAAGQCLRLSVAGGTPLLQTLAGTPFRATTPAEVRDSVQIDLVLVQSGSKR
jgi:hypothetical protein